MRPSPRNTPYEPAFFQPLLRSACLHLPCLLVGCPRDEAAPQSASAAPAQVAVARGRIDVEGGLLKLGVSRDGVVSDITVREGQHVRKGQLLASLDSELARLAVSAAQTEQQQVQLQARQLEKQASFAELKAKRLAKAAAAGAGDGQSADDAREAAQQLRYAIETNRTQAAVAARKLTAARYELEQRNLRAPVEAEVVRRLIQPGATVSPQSGPAFVLLPSEERIVRAELNESFTGVVVPGMKAEITDDSGSGLPPLSAVIGSCTAYRCGVWQQHARRGPADSRQYAHRRMCPGVRQTGAGVVADRAAHAGALRR